MSSEQVFDMVAFPVQAGLYSACEALYNSLTCSYGYGSNMASNVGLKLIYGRWLIDIYFVLAIAPKEEVQGVQIGGVR